MLNTIVILLMVLPSPARAKPHKAPLKKISVSSASLGIEVGGGTGLPEHSASTAPLTIQLITQRFAETDAQITTLKASFRQFLRSGDSDIVQTVEGDVVFKKPNLLRLTHRIPEAQTIVSDGTWLWVHRKSTNQVIQSRLDAWRKSEPLAQGLLDFGKSADLLSRYTTTITTISAPAADGHRLFTLTLTPQTTDKNGDSADFLLILKASTKSFFPSDATLRIGSSFVHSIFEGVRLNPAISTETFHFTPPADADLFKSPEPK